MIELYINGQRSDVEQKPFTYTLQVNDMFNFDTREVSYSETIYLPTTPTNNIIFRFAGEPISDKSEAYKTHKVDYYVNGIPIVQNAIGYLIGKRGNYYIFEFKDKSLNIYNILAGKKLRDLPLYKLNHTKNESFIRKQKNKDNVIYAIADYGRQYSVNTYDYDGCMPSIRMNWVLEQIKNLRPDNSFEGNFFKSDLWESLYMTTSDPKVLNQYEVLPVIEYDGTTKINEYGKPKLYPLKFVAGQYLHENIFIESKDVNPSTFTTNEQGTYQIRVNFYSNRNNKIYLNVNSRVYEISDWTEQDERDVPDGHSTIKYRTLNITLELEANAILLLDFLKNVNEEARIEFVITKYKGANAHESVNDFALTDWFKEVFRMFSITPIFDRKTNKEIFYTLSERINAPIINWSYKFVNIKEEKYHNNNYAQVNHFVYSKYDDQTNEQKNNDYDLKFIDEYLSMFIEIKSKFYGAKNEPLDFNGFKIPRFEFWQQELKNGQVEFKEKDGRFHLFKADSVNKNINAVITKHSEQNLNQSQKITFQHSNLIIANFTNLKWFNLLNVYYKDLPRLLEHPYIVTAEFALNEIDIYEFSFFSRIYVEQLGGYFLPNKIKYKAGAVAEVEMIKIN